jgi:HlyD family secretion protein
MSKINAFVSRLILGMLVAAPLGVMGVLSVNVLLPMLGDPESRFYYTRLGYPALQRKADQPIKIQTVSVETKTLIDSLAAPGESVALQEVDVRPLVSGPVEKVYVVEGQFVRRGQPLLQLQKAPFEDRVNTARNNLATAEKNLQTWQSAAPARLADLKENVKSAQERLAAAKTRLATIDALAEREVQNNIAAAKVRLQTAEQKLKQIRTLVEQGAIAKFQLYDMEDIYATRKRELLAAEQGVINTQDRRFVNKDFEITRQNEVISAQKDLELAQKNLDKEIANARLARENSRIELQEALRNLDRTVIYASMDGLVSRVFIHSGEVAEPRNSLMKMTQDVVFKAYIDQAKLNAINVGDLATLRLVSYPGRAFQGRVIRLNPTVETEAVRPGRVGIDRQYTYSVWVTVENLQMPPGLQGYVQFDKGKTSLVIPESAVTHLSAGEGMVMVAVDGKAVVRKVKLGRIFDNQREVLEGLQPGEQVVPSARALNPGDRLEIDPVEAQNQPNKMEAYYKNK